MLELPARETFNRDRLSRPFRQSPVSPSRLEGADGIVGTDWSLRYVEDKGNGEPLFCPEIPEYTPVQISYHVGLCDEAGYLHIIRSQHTKRPHRIISLTWEGHEFLKHNRD